MISCAMIISYGMYYNRSKIRNQPVLKKKKIF
nr:MAG TPA: hypothetical protein [Caudoviricetes sp.]